MGRGEGANEGAEIAPGRKQSPKLSPQLLKVLAPATARAWTALVPLLPRELYLGGGTAVAVHLSHRESQDLDFFFHKKAVNLKALASKLKGTGQFWIDQDSPGTLTGLFGETKVEFFHLDEDEEGIQILLEKPQLVEGLHIAGLKDLLAMKLMAIGGRGEMRDYFDVKLIEEQGGLLVEDGLVYWIDRYQAGPGGARCIFRCGPESTRLGAASIGDRSR